MNPKNYFKHEYLFIIFFFKALSCEGLLSAGMTTMPFGHAQAHPRKLLPHPVRHRFCFSSFT